MELTEAVAVKVLETVDAGLCGGVGKPVPGKMCVEAAVCFALGLPHGDNPPCVGTAVRRFKMRLNDSRWPSDQARASGMRKLAVAQLGSDSINQLEFATKVTLKTIQRILPKTLRLIGQRVPARVDEFESLAIACEQATDLASARTASVNAKKAAYAYAYAYAAAAAAAYADAAAAAAAAAYAAADAAADAAAYAAAYAYAYADARHEILLMSAEIGLEALVECGSPGCQWLPLCDLPSTALATPTP
jgi:hypothetical protein